jgi:hypothetical protein
LQASKINSCLRYAALAAGLSSVPAFGASSGIGVVTSVGSFSVNHSAFSGTANIADGSALQTAGKPSDIRLQNGTDVELGTRSEGQVFGDHLVLGHGAVRVNNFDKYTIDALKLQVKSDAPGSSAVVRVKGNRIEVASLSGSVRVMEGDSTLIRLAAGTHTAFQQTGAASSSAARQPSAEGQILPISDRTAFTWAAGILGVAAIGLGAAAIAMR